MTEAEEIVNKALTGDDNPSTYVDWLGKKEALGSAGQVRFGIHIHTTDEETIALNAKEDGTVTDDAFWKQINDDARWLEENAAICAREFGLYVQGEGHGESGEYVGSAWISASAAPTWDKNAPLLQQQIAVVQKILALDGDMPSTTDGTFWKFFPGSSSKLYRDVSQEVGAKYLDVMVEFTGTEALADWLKLNIVEAKDVDDPEAFVRNYVPKLSGRLMIEFLRIKPSFPHAPDKNFYREGADGISLFRNKSADQMREVIAQMRAYNDERMGAHQGTPGDVSTYRYPVPNPANDPQVRSFLTTAGVPAGTMEWIEETNPPIWFYMPGHEFAEYLRLVYPQIKLSESEDVDNPEGYLDKVTGWIDTFLRAGMTQNQDDKTQFFKKYECHLTNYWIHVHVREPLWIVVLRTDPATGNQRLNIPFTFVERDTKGMVTQFMALDRLLTKCLTRTRPDWPAVDAEIVDMEKQNERDRMLKLAGKRKIGEAVDDPELQQLLDKASPEPCYACYADLTQPFSVIRHYTGDDSELTLEGHYDPTEGIFTNDEPYSSEFLDKLSRHDLCNDPDTCKACGKSTAKPNSMRSESEEPDLDPQRYVDQIHDLAEITHEIQNFGMFVNRIHPWGRWLVLSGGAYWATLHGEGGEPLKAEFFQQQIDHFMTKLGITKYYTKLGQTGTDNEHVWYQLGIPKSQLEQESWQPFIRNTSWPEASEEIAKWLPEAADPDDPSVNVDRHLDTMDADKVLTALGFSQYRPAYHPTGFEYWENFDFNTGLDWHAVRKSDEEPHIIEVRIYRSVPKKVNNYAFADKVQIGGFSCHIGELPAKLQKAKAMKWYVKGDDTVWHKNVQLLNGVQEALDPDSPEANVDRHTAALDVNAVLTRFGFKKDTNWDLWLKTVGNKQWRVGPTTITNVYSVLRLKRPAKFVQIGRGRRHGQWSDEGSFTCHATELEQQLREEGALNEALDPDAPEPNIERFADHKDKVAQAKLGATIDDALVAYEAALQRRGFNTARQADELAAEMGAELAEKAGYPNGSDEFDHIVSALSNAAGTLFPGDWEDYPVQEAEATMDWTHWLNMMVAEKYISQKAADRYHIAQTLDSNTKIEDLFYAVDSALQNGEDAEGVSLLQRAASVIQVANMRYGSAIKDTMRKINVDEDDNVDPEQYIKNQPLEVLARITLDRTGDSEQFDCSMWFEQASLEQLVALAKGGKHFGFGSSDEADSVARFFSDTTLEDLFERIQKYDEPFEVNISEVDAKRWIEHNRPDWYPYLWPDDMVIESVDDPNPQFMQDTFDVPTILKRMGYEQHSPASPWFKVFNRMPTNLDMMIEVQRRGLGGETNEADVVYDATLYHYLVSPNVKKEWSPIAHRYKRNNKQLEPMLKALEARVAANKLRGIVTDPGIETNPEFDDFVTEPGAEPEVNESVDDPDDPSTVIAAHTQDLVADPDTEVKLNKHPHGEAEAELQVLGFEPSWIAGKNTIYGEPEIPNFWSKKYRGRGSSKMLFLKLNPDKDAASISVRTRAMSIPVALKPRSMAHVVTIIKDVDAAVQRAADNNLTKEQEIDAIIGVLDHHRQWCHPS